MPSRESLQIAFRVTDIEKELLIKYIEDLESAILSVPEFVRYPWDWKECIFCKGKRSHAPDCIRFRLSVRRANESGS